TGPARDTSPTGRPRESESPGGASRPARARARPGPRSGPPRDSARTARGSRGRSGPPRNAAPSVETWLAGPSSRARRRIVAAVGRKLQELVGLVRPELADPWGRMDGRVGARC